MKHVFILFLLMQVFSAKMFAQNTFTNYGIGRFGSEAFTTNNFKCIGVGKGNLIWAGSQYGGLYFYNEQFKSWTKSENLTNVFINDIKADADSGIWIAQSGLQMMGGNSNIAGGINYFRVASDNVNSMRFFSVAGTTTRADLLSRNVRSLYIDQRYGEANSRLPRVWATQGIFISQFTTKRGGLSIGLNDFLSPRFFNNNDAGYDTLSAARTPITPLSEAIGGNKEEVWVAVRQNRNGSQILRYNPDGTYINTPYDNRNVPLLPFGFSAQAILFDEAGNRWIGLKSGGLVIKQGDNWLKMDIQSLITPGAQININAMVEDENGNVYIGTSDGMLQYMSRKFSLGSSPDYPPSYKRYTTLNGLPDNNVTGLAYDKKYGRLLITTSAGVTFMNIREPFIKGVVADVTSNPDDEKKVYPGLQTKRLSGGILTARLFKDGVEEDFDYPDLNGEFEFTKANDVDLYTIEIVWLKNNRTIKYVYNNIRNHTKLQPILIPDGLIEEIKTYKASMEKRCFPLKVSLGAVIPVDIFCAKGFNVNGYESPGDEFYVAGGLSSNIQKRVDNLAGYFLAMKTVYKLGGDATDLYSDMIANAIDGVQSLQAFFTLGKTIKKNAKLPTDKLKLAGIEEKALVEGIRSTLILIKEGINHTLTALAGKISDDATKKKVETCIGFCNDAADLCITLLKDGGEGLATNLLIDNLKKVIATAAVTRYYASEYAGDRHRDFIPTSRLSAMLNQSEIPYEEIYDKLYSISTVGNSLAKQSADILLDRQNIIKTAVQITKYASNAGEVFDAGRTLALIPGAQFAAGVFTGLSIFSKSVNTFAFGVASYFGAVGSSEVTEVSDKILTEAQLNRPEKWAYQRSPVITQDLPAVLTTLKNDYNLKLTQMQAAYNMPVFDSTTYRNAYYALKKSDSLYSIEFNRTLHRLAASNDSAIKYVAGYSGHLDKLMDSFITRQYTYRQSMFYRNLAYVYDSVKTTHAMSLDTITREIKRLGDSSVAGLSRLITDINNNGIAAPAHLVEDSVIITHSHLPGSAGNLRFYFTNYGAQTQNNVSFKMKDLTVGYSLTSADSVNVGSILPGRTKEVSFSFLSPMHDSIGRYQIDVKAANGKYQDLSGTFFVVDPTKYFSLRDGDWNNPATWSSNLVPGPTNKVYISHNVNVTTDVTTKSVTVYKPGSVNVATGRRVIINK